SPLILVRIRTRKLSSCAGGSWGIAPVRVGRRQAKKEKRVAHVATFFCVNEHEVLKDIQQDQKTKRSKKVEKATGE
ncbi:hypothetical protein, partial [Bacillus mesophilus]|uniref:hypothetical protein n=1 Tax=Bacillus mesophilus TaxID=1808955 RepID=UPI001969ED2A